MHQAQDITRSSQISRADLTELSPIYSVLSSAVFQAPSCTFIRVWLIGLLGEAHGSEDTDWCKRKSQIPKKRSQQGRQP